VWVANIGARTLTEITVDADAGLFTVGREFDFAADPRYATLYGDWETPPGPVCHQYTPDGRYAYVTLGPAAGGLVVVDLDELEIVEAFDPEVVRANCGVMFSGDGAKAYANWGSVTQDEGEWYVFDTATHTLMHTGGSRGVDPHGVMLHPDGRHLWMVNRASDNAIVIDTATDEVVREIAFVGESPDILDFSPDGRLAFVSLRGPEPRSGPHAIAGTTPGFSVVDTASGDVVEVVQPAPEDERSDFHGVGVRQVTPQVTRLAAADRVATAVAVGDRFFALVRAVGIARGDDFPDALAAGAHAVRIEAPMLLAPPGSLHPETAQVLCARPVAQAWLYGGQAAFSADVEQQVAARLAGDGC
jgi:YVTN family beta-propeller protein